MVGFYLFGGLDNERNLAVFDHDVFTAWKYRTLVIQFFLARLALPFEAVGSDESYAWHIDYEQNFFTAQWLDMGGSKLDF